jgi:hypothetical protein
MQICVLNICLCVCVEGGSNPQILCTVKLLTTGQHWDQNYGRFRGVAGFMRLPLQRNVQQGLKESANIQGGPVL